jgi:hypothetical protein
MIHGTLIFEYVDYRKLLAKIGESLKISGVLSMVIQLEDADTPKIGETKFTSLKKLSSIMKMVDIDVFRESALNSNLSEIYQELFKP